MCDSAVREDSVHHRSRCVLEEGTRTVNADDYNVLIRVGAATYGTHSVLVGAFCERRCAYVTVVVTVAVVTVGELDLTGVTLVIAVYVATDGDGLAAAVTYMVKVGVGAFG